jgi:hypothetical protein
MPGADVLQLRDGLIACFGACARAVEDSGWRRGVRGKRRNRLNEKGNLGVLGYSG